MTDRLTNSQQWTDCLRFISQRVKSQAFNTWLKSTKGDWDGNGAFKITVPNQFVADWINDHFREVIDEAFENVLGKRYDVIWVLGEPNELEEQTSLDFAAPLPAPTTQPRRVGDATISDHYNFDTLVIGDFNSFAAAASRAVAEAPGMNRYNPLFIYGGTGLGKTHLVHAIAHELHRSFPNKRVVYATSERFTREFISAITDRSISDFTRYYRDVDCLIIDDIQFFTGKEGTQEQFFHTFNALYHAGKQIILTSDRPPKEIKGLEERLLSRFSWGLVADLQAPDLENRTAILYRKLEREGATIPEGIVTYIADTITTNIRELEGALTCILAYSTHRGVPVDMEMARKVLGSTVSGSRKEITIEMIQKKTCDHFKLELSVMTAKKKTAKIALARQVAMHLSRTLTDNSLKLIGASFGGRDHSTVIHACDLISRRMSSDSVFKEKIDRLTAAILY